ncbi:hypothetical protein EXIGLDRAFT_750409 [Exidia glandulosa HHB12029]|uniref:CFEM domain-containing protein n=1 Tax=Exidia glandulosa HHB12029 TaxID=1314781 RepID=A0A165GSA6_EXIGL|nr:hypothetical protein EXIGLDRAFT_750409 [Exidia glandulosa HHB12029]
MRFATALVAAFLAAASVVAQDQDSIPPCLATCSAAPPDGCPSDPNAAQKCACENNAYVANSTACLEVTCTSAAEFETAQLIAVTVCAQQGVALSPSGTWKGPQSTTASGSAPASGSSTATSAEDSTTAAASPSTSPSQTADTGAAYSNAVPAVAVFLGSALLALAL